MTAPARAADAADEQAVCASVFAAINAAECFDTPYRHWILRDLLPGDMATAFSTFDLPPADVGGVSGKRELHNDQRHYFDAARIAADHRAGAFARAFQSGAMARRIAGAFGADLDGTCLRVEYAQDTDGFWLEPHTDLGVKRLTLLIYLPGVDDGDQSDLGTDIYDLEKRWAKRARFDANAALAFTPGADTYHGFEKRPIKGVRRSLIVNYVTDEWRAREQLCFPDQPVRL